MAGRNFTRGFGGGLYEAVSDADVPRRTELVRRAKDAVGGRGLTDTELDAVLPPVECLRTRIRVGRLVAIRDTLAGASCS